jgi:hypothetical protein
MSMNDSDGKYNAHNAKPFVGYVSSGNTIDWVSQGGNLVCQQSSSAAMILGFIVFMIITGILCASQSPEVRRLQYFFEFSWQEQLGHVLVGGFIVLMVGATLVFAVERLMLFGTLVVDSNGVLRFCQGFNRQEVRVIRPGEIEGLRMTQVSFRGKRVTHINFLLILQLRNGEEVVLCASPENELVLKIRDEIGQRVGIKQEVA